MSVQNAIEITSNPTALYRLYADDGTLLYVGITRNIGMRFLHHRGNKPWWPEVARWTMAWYPSRREASAAELAAIASERPVHNVLGATPKQPRAPRPKKVPYMLMPRSPRKAPKARKYPAHLRMARILQAKIASGDLPPGSKLGEAELRAEFMAGVVTVRRALSVLYSNKDVDWLGENCFVKDTAPSLLAAPAPLPAPERPRREKKKQQETTGKSDSAEEPVPLDVTFEQSEPGALTTIQPGGEHLQPGVWHGVRIRCPNRPAA